MYLNCTGTRTSLANLDISTYEGSTSNITKAPIKFLGHTLARCPTQSKRSASAKLKEVMIQNLEKINVRPIRGEIKLWILQYYLIPAIHFQLMVNNIQQTTIATLENRIMKLIKKWLKLPRNATRAIIHHPSVINLPTISYQKNKAKLALLSTLTCSTDPAILELSSLIASQSYLENVGITKEMKSLHQMLDAGQGKKALKSAIRRHLLTEEKHTWNKKLQSLEVQSKFSQVIKLEESTKLWGRIMDGLPGGQLPFLLKAGSDTLPTPMNLHRWRIQTSPACRLCKHSPCTTAHVLSGCPTALEDGRFTWRHDSVLQSIYKHLRNTINDSFKIFADLPGLRATESPPATMPQEVTITSYRPDLVLTHGKEVHLFELTVCGNSEQAMAAAHQRKSTKQEYIHLISDATRTGWKANYTTLEIGVLGHYLPSTPTELSAACPNIHHTYWLKILQSTAKIAISCSYSIFLARDELKWSPRPLLPS